ncbi:MAG: hypothetical protein J6B81_02545 [Spirochaetaceae bacterium]|nr:hypothetical protein [Spirochaetaceae bacterium]
MKSQFVKIGISSVLFIALIFASLLAVRPAIYKFEDSLIQFRDNILLQIEQKTGLSVSYESLSPSVFSIFRIKGIVLKDVASDNTVLEIKRASLSYEIGRLLKGDFFNAFKKLTITGITLEYDSEKNQQLLQKIMALFKNSKSGTEDNISEPKKTSIGIIGGADGPVSIFVEEPEEDKADEFLPFDIEINDVSLHYSDSMIDGLVTLRDVTLNSASFSEFFNATLNGTVKIDLLPSLLSKLPEELQKDNARFSGTFSGDASISPVLDGSVARIRLDSLGSRGLSLARTSFLVEFNNQNIKLSTMQDTLPFSLLGEYNLAKKLLQVRADMNSFDPFELVTVKSNYDLISKLKGTKLSGNYELQWDSNSQDINYSGKGGLYIPESFVPQGLNLNFDILGNFSDIAVNNLEVFSPILDLSLNGNFNIPNLAPSGTIFLERFLVPGSGSLSAELYLDPLERGFVCFIPQLYLGERSFTALQLTLIPDENTRSVDFAFEFSDYSHIEFGSPGEIILAGSLIGGESPFVQAQIEIENFFIDAALYAVSFFLPEKNETFQKLADSFSPYMTTTELYVSTDFNSLTYNAPYWIVANTEQDQNLIYFSFTGNENNLILSQFDLLFGNNAVQLAADVGMDRELGGAFFTADATVNSIPYSFAGTYMQESGLQITGNYGLELALNFLSEDIGTNLIANLKFTEFPVALSKAVLLCSTNMDAVLPLYDMQRFEVGIQSLSLSEASGLLSFNPQLSMSGKVNNYGLMLDSFVYNDTVSLLNGSGGLMWLFESGVMESASLNLSLANPVSSESYSVSATLSNPENQSFSVASLMKDFYFSAQVMISDFPMSRVLPLQSEINVCSAMVSAMGTMENPYVALQIEPSSMSFGGVPFSFKGSALLDDGDIYLEETEIVFNKHSVTGISGVFSLAEFAGSLKATYDGQFGKSYNINAPIEISVLGMSELQQSETDLFGIFKRGIPELLTANLDMKLGGTLFDEVQPVKIELVRMQDYIALSSYDDLGLSGYITSGGNFDLNLSGRMPLHADIHGIISNQLLDVHLDDISSDLSNFSHLVYFPFVALYGGILKGNAQIGGILADPELNGNFYVEMLDLNCPNYVQEHIIGKIVPISLRDNELKVNKVPFTVGPGRVFLDLGLRLDRWKLDLFSMQIKTPENVFIPALINVAPFVIGGDSTCDLDIQLTLNNAEINGRFYTENVKIEFLSEMIQQLGSGVKTSRIPFTLNIDVTTGQHVEIEYNPLLRGLIAPNTNIAFQFDSATKDIVFKSDVVLRGGEITYLNRNFYLREGRIMFNESGGVFDPRITVRAEIRERDQNGEPVRITLSAENQRLSEFNPSYTSSPPKSELELMTLLGQAVTGDVESGWDVLLTGVDYGFQVFVLRKIENALRDLLNFDIFSLRTMGFQNSLRQWINGSDSEPLTISNFLDNTTVYIGKYFGSSIYADAMFHFAYDESKVASGESVSGLVFQPEIGLEMDSPFGTIRWSMAPEIGTTQHLWVPATSITLSWKFVF